MNDDNVQRMVERMSECRENQKTIAYSQADKYDEIIIGYELQKPESKEYSAIIISGRIGKHTYVLNSVNVGSGVIKLSDLTDIKKG